MASILIKTGQHADYCYPLGRRTTVIGRGEALFIQIIDQQVSRKHLQIRYDPTSDSYLAVDLKSLHGVFINGTKISRETPLKDNDLITIGNTTLLFTAKDFSEHQYAIYQYKKVGERTRLTLC